MSDPIEMIEIIQEKLISFKKLNLKLINELKQKRRDTEELVEHIKYLKKYQHIDFEDKHIDNFCDLYQIQYNSIGCPNTMLDCFMMEHNMDKDEQIKFYRYVVPKEWRDACNNFICPPHPCSDEVV